MVEFSREHLQEGHLAMIWKDTTFNYSYFLWFEDLSVSCWKEQNILELKTDEICLYSSAQNNNDFHFVCRTFKLSRW